MKLYHPDHKKTYNIRNDSFGDTRIFVIEQYSDDGRLIASSNTLTEASKDQFISMAKQQGWQELLLG